MNNNSQMNCIFIKTGEFLPVESDQNKYHILVTGERAHSLISDHQLKTGLEISCVLQNKFRARLKIIDIESDKPECKIKAQAIKEHSEYARTNIRLAVAFSRPQTMKKIMQLAASFGLVELNFVKTDKVVDSYLQSKVLATEQIEQNFILGCQQSCDPFFPNLKRFYSLKSFIESCEGRTDLYFGDPATSATNLASDAIAGSVKTLLLGPESGFSAEERNFLLDQGFKIISLGPRMLRLEVAASALIGRLL